MSVPSMSAPLIIDLQGTSISPSEEARLQHPAVGGVILFARNYQDPRQLTALTQQIRALRSDPILICADQEGGRVQRFRDGFTRLPSMHALHALNDQQALIACANILVHELLIVGVDAGLAPVMDVDNGSEVIGDRAFSHDPAAVSESGRRFAQAMQAAGMATTAKHFPGHGTVQADTHFQPAIDQRDLASLIQTDLLPFINGIRANAFDSVMLSHVIHPQVCSQPAGFSSYWQQFLRQRLGFAGVVLSDDLGMVAAGQAGDLVARCVRALQAGCDGLLLCNLGGEVEQALKSETLLSTISQSTTVPLSTLCARRIYQGIPAATYQASLAYFNELSLR